ncbi:MAG: hypothetical protein SPI06_05950 [Terrisporobacter sp.]|uniref:hypothetical protein n=1 Tax=Terrisporobacter sp. TaxID=1965305 RepID=UPI002A91DD13|nr:hypothetical protein [Terrisporobacter sp.]MDY6152936.1 hypothetical protein [Terrisporobacter sp.]
MSCEFGMTDCKEENTNRCILCINKSNYSKLKVKSYGIKPKARKVDRTKRQGSIQEVKAYEQTKSIVEGTPNSGAGAIKGDLEIGNMAMIECKTTTKKNLHKAPGKESFTIKRAWLDKLRKEAAEAKKEFNYLIFSFKELDDDLYAVTDLKVINSMIATMKHDREQLNDTNRLINMHKTRSKLIEAENSKLIAEIDYLKAQLEYYKNNKNKDK